MDDGCAFAVGFVLALFVGFVGGVQATDGVWKKRLVDNSDAVAAIRSQVIAQRAAQKALE